MTTVPSRKQCGEPQRSKVFANKVDKVSASDDPSLARATNLEEMKKKLAGTGNGKSGGGGKHKRKKKGHGKRFRLPSLSQDGELVRQELKPKPINMESSDKDLGIQDGEEGQDGKRTKKMNKWQNSLQPTKTLKAYAYFSKSQTHLKQPPLYAEIPTIGSYHIGIAMGVPGVPSNGSFHNKQNLQQQQQLQQSEQQMLSQSQPEIGFGGKSKTKHKPIKNPKLKLHHQEKKHPDTCYVYGPNGISVYSSA